MPTINSLTIFSKCFDCARHPVGIFISMIILTGVIHWTLVQLYSHLCAPMTLKGLVTTFLALGSPLCHFINTIQYEIAKHYIALWAGGAVTLVAWMATRLGKG